jgi:hypothetical protein
MALLNYIKVTLIAALLSSCMIEAVDSSYTPTANVVGYERGDTTFASVDPESTSDAIIPQSTPATPTVYSSLASSNGNIIRPGVMSTPIPQPVQYQQAQPVVVPPVMNSYPVVGGTVTTTTNGIPVIINNAAPSQPYSSLSSGDKPVIQQNIFGTQVAPNTQQMQVPYYGQTR